MFPYRWNLKETIFTKDKGTVFSCFSCGGGSTMGYKLAGFDVIGCNEIDPKMMDNYRKNHDPKFSYLEPIQTFKLRDDLPEELYNLTILDGSPPCSSFSMSGNREKDWGKEKKFREGQAEQVLDNLFFDFIDLAKKLQPKVVVAENVAGLMMGNAKDYVIKIYQSFKDAGYQLKIEPYLLDSSLMGVPQVRERVFFIAIRNDIADPFLEQLDMFQIAPRLELNFNMKPIPFKEIDLGATVDRKPVTGKYANRIFNDSDNVNGRAFSEKTGNPVGYYYRARPDKVLLTIKATQRHFYRDFNLWMHDYEVLLGSSFPLDYKSNVDVNYLCGMSVPPVMVAMIAKQIHEQWLSKL